MFIIQFSGLTFIALTYENRATGIPVTMQTVFEHQYAVPGGRLIDVDLSDAHVEPPGEVPAPSPSRDYRVLHDR